MRIKAITTTAVAVFLLCACAGLKGGYSIPSSHPEELSKNRPVCSSCHEAGEGKLVYKRFDHTTAFARGDHKNEAYQDARVCEMCHAQSYCNDCHVTRTELKPETRRASETYRQMPHRGDYRTRHRIDGRLDPASCYSCHGNPKASASCAVCHGK
jgi:hypothetical protein